jgi:hypothetical protein
MAPRGQASAEYTALLALAAIALGTAGAVVGLEGVGKAVTATVRTGICIVGGDVCRQSDAIRAGLAPCTLADRTEGGAATITVFSIRVGERGEWTAARRSDGSVVVTRRSGVSLGATAGIGIEASPLALKFGAKGAYDMTFDSGKAWELPSLAAARRLLEADDDDRPPPTWRWGAFGGELSGKAGVTAGGAMLTGVEASAGLAEGVKVGKDRTTLYMRARLEAPAFTAWLPGGNVKHGGAAREVVMELTRERGELREIAFRTIEPGRSGEVVETVGRLDLREPANRAAVAPLLDQRLPWPSSVQAGLRAAVRRTVQAGVVERAVYAVEDDESRKFELSAKLGLEVGLKAEQVAVQRQLVEATAWTGGAGPRERVDCLGEERS